jgi:hypothetical protein
MISFSVNFAIGFFVVCAMIFTYIMIHIGKKVDPAINCITCGEPCYQDFAGIWRHEARRLDVKHPAIPRKAN